MRHFFILPLVATFLVAQGKPELVISVGHAGAPSEAAFVGDYLATADWSNVALIDLASGLTIARLPQGSLVTALEGSPSGDVLAVATCSDGVKLWDVNARSVMQRVAADQECPDDLAFSSDGALLATSDYACCDSGGVRIWNARTGALVQRLDGHTGSRSVVFGRGDGWIATVDNDGRATVGEWPSRRQLHTFSDAGEPIGSHSVLFASGSGNYLGWLGRKGLRVFDVSSGTEVPLPGARSIRILDKPRDGPERERTEEQIVARTATFLGDGRLAYVDGDELILRRLPDGPEQRLSLPEPAFDARGDVAIAKQQDWLAIRRDGRLLAGARESQTVTWDVASSRLRVLEAAPLIAPTGLHWSRSGLIAMPGLHSGILAWNEAGGTPVNLGTSPESADAVAFQPDGSRLAVMGYAKIAILEVAQRRTIATRDIEPDGNGLAFSADGSRLAFASGAHGFTLFDTRLMPVRTLTKLDHFTGVDHAAFSPDGTWIAASISGANPTFSVWPVREGGGVTLDQTDVTYGPQPPAFSADSRHLATFSRGDQLRIWSTTGWKEERKWTLPRTGRALAFAPQGLRLAIASDNGATIWDAGTGTKLITLTSPASDDMTAIAWSPDGRRVVAAADDGVLRFWNASDGRLQGSLYLFESGRDWLLVTPDGRIDGTDRALTRSVAWRVGQQVRLNRTLTRQHRTVRLWRQISAEHRVGLGADGTRHRQKRFNLNGGSDGRR